MIKCQLAGLELEPVGLQVVNCFNWHCRKGKRSALVDHQTKNKEHKQLVQDMELGLKRVMLVGGVAQRLLGKVAIVTGAPGQL